MDKTQYTRLKSLADDAIKHHERAREAYTALHDAHKRGEWDERLNNSYAWVIYYHLRHEQTTMPPVEARTALTEYMLMNPERPSRLHSRILLMAVRLSDREESNFNFVRFFNMWGMDNLLEEDWQQDVKERTDNGTGQPAGGPPVVFSSLAELAIRRYAQKAELQTVEPLYDQLLTSAIKRYPGQELYKYYLARNYAQTGRKELALKAYKRLALTSNQPYVWSGLAELLDDPQQRTATLCKAMLLNHDANRSGRLHLALAQQWIAAGNHPAAACELRQYRDIYQRNGWHLSDHYQRLRQRVPRDTQPAADNHALYQASLAPLDELLYSELPLTMLRVTTVFNDRRGVPTARLTTPDGNALFIPVKRLPGARPTAGTCYQARLVTVNDRTRPVTIAAAT